MGVVFRCSRQVEEFVKGWNEGVAVYAADSLRDPCQVDQRRKFRCVLFSTIQANRVVTIRQIKAGTR
jgi:hypothetical protein